MSDGLFHARLRASSHRLFWLGLAMVVLGFAAIVFPMIFTLVAAFLVGWIMLISGVGTVIGAFSIHGTGPFFGALLLGLLSFAAGIFMLFNPLAGAAALTLVMGVIFVFQGAFELFFAFENAPASRLGGHADLRRCEHRDGGSHRGRLACDLGGRAGHSLGVNFLSTGFGYIFASRALKPAG
jgi:hypothetical protein